MGHFIFSKSVLSFCVWELIVCREMQVINKTGTFWMKIFIKTILLFLAFYTVGKFTVNLQHFLIAEGFYSHYTIYHCQVSTFQSLKIFEIGRKKNGIRNWWIHLFVCTVLSPPAKITLPLCIDAFESRWQYFWGIQDSRNPSNNYNKNATPHLARSWPAGRRHAGPHNQVLTR